MLKSVEGIYRNGRIDLLESPPSDLEGKVIVTFLNGGSVDLTERGVDGGRRRICASASSHLAKIGIGPKWISTMPYSRGDVVLMLYPDSNLARQSGGRPFSFNRTISIRACPKSSWQ